MSMKLAIDLAELDVEPLSTTQEGSADLDSVATGQGFTELTASSTCSSASCSCCLACCCCCW